MEATGVRVCMFIFISYCVVESTHLCTVNKKDKDEEIIFK